MTHEELLAKIQSDYEENKHFRDAPKWKPFAALHAVVELHKLIDDNSCHHCVTWYPCPTIQAIEKELN